MKNTNIKRRSQLWTLGIIIISLLGILVINTDRVTADNQQKDIAVVNETEATQENVLSGYSSSIFPSMLKLVSALALVIACIYVALFLFKKLMGNKVSGNRKNNIMEVLETTYVGPKKTVSLIRVADKSVLVGTTESNISILTELDEEKTSSILKGMKTESEKENFKNLFQTASDKIKELSLKRKTKTALET